MADTKISNLTALAAAPAVGDLLAIVDVSESETKKITTAHLFTSPAFTTQISTPAIVTASGALTVTPAAGSGVNIVLSTTGDLAVNTDDLYVDTSTGNVAINSTGSAFRFDIVDNNVGKGTMQITNTTAGTSARAGIDIVGDGGSGFIYWRSASATNMPDSLAIASSGGPIILNPGNGTTGLMYLTESGNVGIAVTAPTAKLHVDQSSGGGAIPVLYLDQGDTDQDFIELVGGSSTGNATSISTDAAGAYAGRMQITVNGTRRWISFTADA